MEQYMQVSYFNNIGIDMSSNIPVAIKMVKLNKDIGGK